MEVDVLEGGRQLIANNRPFLFVENNRTETSAEIIRCVESLGYRAYWHIAPYYSANNYFGSDENVFAHVRPEANMLCTPPSVNLEGMMPVMGVEDNWEAALSRLTRH